MKPADNFPLCEYLQDELEARGWTKAYLTMRCCLSADRVNAILSGDRMALHEAEPLALAFGVSALLLLNLQMMWSKANGGE